ncbi:solute carrier family 22 member 7-like [Ornithodoros turicata]|uniref:solute carrier family 22 member 7-like n=1 Tax=Ornithodoros turicata TaxID=34597 RepID=UPI0031391DF2
METPPTVIGTQKPKGPPDNAALPSSTPVQPGTSVMDVKSPEEGSLLSAEVSKLTPVAERPKKKKKSKRKGIVSPTSGATSPGSPVGSPTPLSSAGSPMPHQSKKRKSTRDALSSPSSGEVHSAPTSDAHVFTQPQMQQSFDSPTGAHPPAGESPTHIQSKESAHGEEVPQSPSRSLSRKKLAGTSSPRATEMPPVSSKSAPTADSKPPEGDSQATAAPSTQLTDKVATEEPAPLPSKEQHRSNLALTDGKALEEQVDDAPSRVTKEMLLSPPKKPTASDPVSRSGSPFVTPTQRPTLDEKAPDTYLSPPPVQTSDHQQEQESSLVADPISVCGHGCYQRMALFCSQLAGFVFLSQHMVVVLTTPYTDHWCKAPPQFADMGVYEWRNTNIPREPDGSLSHCLVYDPPLPFGGPSENRTIQHCAEWDFDQSEYTETLQSRWHLVCERSRLVFLLQTVYMSGAMAAVPIAGLLSDRVGRKVVVVVSVAIFLISGFTACFAKTFYIFVASRFLVSGATASIRIFTYILLFEISTPDLRFFNCVVVQTGLLAATVFTYTLKQLHLSVNWVLIILLIPAACLICTGFMIQESPRWLLAVSDYKGAERTLMWAAMLNGVRDTEARTRWKRVMRTAQKSEETLTVNSMFARGNTLKKRSFILYMCWTSTMLAFYHLNLYVNRGISETARLLCALSQAPALAIAFVLMEKAGRRRPFFLTLMTCGVLMLTLPFLSTRPAEELLMDIFVTLANLVANVAVVVIYLYSMELYPTTLRSTGVASCFLFGRLGALMSPALQDLGGVTHSSVPYVLSGIMNIVSGVFATKLSETRLFGAVDSIKQLQKQGQREKLLEFDSKPIRGKHHREP